MIYTMAKADPSYEVRNVVTVDNDNRNHNNNEQSLLAPWNTTVPSPSDWERGIFLFARRILSYSRPSALHQAIFPTKIHTNTSTKSASSSSPDISNAEKEEREERYERLVGGSLDALHHWIRQQYHRPQKHPPQDQQKPPPTEVLLCMKSHPQDDYDFECWWKHWNSSKPTLRRKSYQLLAALVQSQLAQSSSSSSTTTVMNILLPTKKTNNLETLLVQALSNETQSGNIPILFETVLAVLQQQQQQNTDENSSSMHVSTAALVPPLIQQFETACHGTSVREWGPTLLVFVSLFAKNAPHHPISPRSVQQSLLLSLIQAVERGQRHVRGPAEQIRIQMYLAETLAWILLVDPHKLFPPHSPPCLSSSTVNPDAFVDMDWYMELANLWLQVWYAALERVPDDERSATTAHAQVHRQQIREMAQQIVQFEQRSMFSTSNNDEDTSNPCVGGGAFQNREFVDQFWKHRIDLSSSRCHSGTVAQFVQELHRIHHSQPQNTENPKNNKFCRHLVPKLGELFHRVLEPYQQSSVAVPTPDAYQLMHAVLQYCGPRSIFAMTRNDDADVESKVSTINALEKFVMNDVLRWTILHTSLLSDVHFHNADFAHQDFRLFATCQDSIPKDQQSSIWRAFLREILSAKCEIQALVAGLHVLMKHSQTHKDWIVCNELDEYSVEISRSYPIDSETVTLAHSSSRGTTSHHRVDDDASVETNASPFASETYENHLDFFLTCVCIDDPNSMIVSRDAIANWAEVIVSCYDATKKADDIKCVDYEEDSALPVWEALLRVIDAKQSLLDDEKTDRVMMVTWHGLHHLFEKHMVKILKSSESRLARFVSLASNELRRQLDGLISSNSYSTHLINLWTLKAWRLLQASMVNSDKDTFPELDLGFQEAALWKKNPNTMFDLSMSLVEKLDEKQTRLLLLRSWCPSCSEPFPDFLCTILVALSEANALEAYAYRTRDREDRSATFLSAVIGEDVNDEILDELLDTILVRIKAGWDDEDDSSLDNTRRSVAVMSQLLDFKFQRVAPAEATDLDPNDISEGDRLWYIVDPTNPNVREEATVVKLHDDKQAGLYFTIRCHGRSQERQTVIERLRREQRSHSMDGCIPIDRISVSEWEQRSHWCKRIAHDIIVSKFSRDARIEAWGEMVNLLVSQIGLDSKRGIGSDHYSIHRCVRSLEESLIKACREENIMVVSRQLRVLSLALGYGVNTPSSTLTSQQITINPVPIFEALTKIYNTKMIGEQPELDGAAMQWFAVSLNLAQDYDETKSETIRQALLLLFQIAANYLNPPEQDFVSLSYFMIACKAIHDGLITNCGFESADSAQNVVVELNRSQQNALSHLVNSMAIVWSSSEHMKESANDKFQEALLHSDFPRIVQSAHHKPKSRNLLAIASSRNADVLVKLLFDPLLRHYALILLDLVATTGKSLRSPDEVEKILSEQTCQRLRIWSAGLEEEEAAEVEEDIYIVAEWVPIVMMETIESWIEHDFEELDTSTTIGQFLTWLCFLRFVESAAPHNFRNRPAFVSYAGKCGSVGAILNIAVLHDDFMNDQKRKAFSGVTEFEKLLWDESSLKVSKLSSLCLFRTVEVLPSLSRRWWEEECPKVYSNPVQLFVEKYVSPEILKREIDRIKSNSSFGQMSVAAGFLSREVTATYVQDDFTLKVSISLPSLFPFRNAEVDCSKTLGVPQTRWKLWSLQITLMLNSQGGTLLDALMLWKDNVDKEFEGVEPCPVCYSVLHVKTHKLPSLECKTCHNRFHFDCLTQWFRSSGKSQCVLCQQPWQGTRI
jgi:hypothetical protein